MARVSAVSDQADEKHRNPGATQLPGLQIVIVQAPAGAPPAPREAARANESGSSASEPGKAQELNPPKTEPRPAEVEIVIVVPCRKRPLCQLSRFG